MSMAIKYLTVNNILAIHDRVLEIEGYSKIYRDIPGGNSGIDNFSNLDNTVSRVQYSVFGLKQDIFTKSAILMQGINCGHVFIDGNKRTAYMSVWLFLQNNGYELEPDIKEAETFVKKMAMDCSKYPIKRIRGWILRNIRKV